MGKKCKVKLDVGTVYQKEEGGNYYFRYQVQHERKCVSLKTSNQEEALEKARKLLPIIQATTEEVISAHVKVARHLVLSPKSGTSTPNTHNAQSLQPSGKSWPITPRWTK